MPAAVEIQNVWFGYEGIPVLEAVDLRISHGDFATIIGPNGGGKTTLLRLILGLVEPQAGSIRVLDTSPIAARPRIGYMPQLATMDPTFPVRVLDVVLMGRLGPRTRIGPLSAADRRAAAEALDKVGLGGLARRPFSALSGGQRQRALLARALASNPELLLLDEPATGLDQKVEEDFFELLRDLNRTTTLLLVSHDIGFVSAFVNTVVCVHRTVHLHPMSELDGAMIQQLYGGEVRLVHHDRRL